MTLIYDDNIDSSYDLQSTLEFVEPKPEEKEKQEQEKESEQETKEE